MTSEQVVLIVEASLNGVLLATLFMKLVPTLRLDSYRQKMFAIRDELWDYAYAGNINFDDPAYRLLRQSMNGYIRYGHQITFFRVCISVIRWAALEGKPNLTWNEKWEKALERIQGDDVRSRLLKFHNEATSLFIERLVVGSPLLIVALAITIVMVLLHMGLKNLKLACEIAAVRAVSFIVDPNLIQEEAAAESVA